ncbi:hypothetical protein F2Q69_00054238 [Brassica cretica]|uniref:Uncharacterized protein n=1 Tax=Brassica cretica TaxID=69181 RepID=A0A8S9MTX9_BRACR|nr:hypothetical protein F2Q69_00054238 [Brassica cretica]
MILSSLYRRRSLAELNCSSHAMSCTLLSMHYGEKGMLRSMEMSRHHQQYSSEPSTDLSRTWLYANKAIELDPLLTKTYLRKGVSNCKKCASIAPSEFKFKKLIDECDLRISEEEKELVEPVASPQPQVKADLTLLPLAPAKPKFRHDYYQKPEEVVVTIFAKAIPMQNVNIDFGEQIGARFQGPSSGFLPAGTWSIPLSGTRGSGSCLDAGGNDIGAPLRQNPVPLILLSWVPLKPELILNLGEDRFLRAGENGRDDTGNGFLKISLVLRVPRTEGIGSLIVLRDSFSRAVSLFLRMVTNGLDLALGSSSIGTSVHSRRRVGNEACESMDSSESSLDLTTEIEELRNSAIGVAPPPPGGDRLSPVGPLSVIGVEEVANWRKNFCLPDDVTIRIPGPFDRVSDFELGEIPVYESFFESGFGDQIPSLVAEISKAVKISPGQLNPPSWRILIAMQNLGDLEGFTVGVADVLYCYSISPLNGGEFRYHLHPRGKAFPLVPARLSLDGDSFAAISSLQGDPLQVACHVLCLDFATSLFIGWIMLTQAASQRFHFGERMEDNTTAKAEVDALTVGVKNGYDEVNIQNVRRRK